MRCMIELYTPMGFCSDPGIYGELPVNKYCPISLDCCSLLSLYPSGIHQQMSRISSTYRTLKQQNRKALVTFVTAGDPDAQLTPEIMLTLVRNGADLIELGVPFSDPMADGPVIQRANERALERGIALADVLQMVAHFRRYDPRTPVVLMGYLNPIEVFGYAEFAENAATAGVDGVIIVDMPPEESLLLNRQLRTRNIDQIFLVTPVTSERRIEIIAKVASGFLYYVSVKGTTGGKEADALEVADKLRILRCKTDLPLAVGFGIKDAATAARVAEYCDAVVIGSALVETIHAAATAGVDISAEVGSFVGPVRASLDRAA